MMIIQYIKKGISFIFNAYYRFDYLSDLGLYHNLSDEDFLKRKFYTRLGYELDLDNPKSFNEKLQWLKLNDHNPQYTFMVDKLTAKKYVEDRIGAEYIIPTIATWDTVDDINWRELPPRFVLKCTHDSGGVFICKDKNSFNIKNVKKRLRTCLKHNYYFPNREWPYKNIRPRIIAEKYMVDKTNGADELTDYKLMCFNGKFKCAFVGSERYSDSGLHITFFDRNWNVLPFERHYPKSVHPIEKPLNFNKMIQLAEKLSEGIPFLRVDFYEIDGKIYFGELTFYPGSGFEEFTPISWDYTLGDWLELPIK